MSLAPRVVTLPGGVSVVVRDWLSANHVLLQGESGRIIIDTGYFSRAAATRAAVETVFGECALDWIVNTHQHSDHMGCNAYLQRWTGARIAVPEGERGALARWDGRELWLDYADQACEWFAPDVYLVAGEKMSWGDAEWEAIAAPGHDDGTLMFYNPQHKILITADALWEHGLGFVSPKAWDPDCATRAHAALAAIAALDVAVVIPGHGSPFTNVAAALDVARAKLRAIEADDQRAARSISKGMFIFAMLARGEYDVHGLTGYVQTVGCHRDLNAEFFHLDPVEHGQWLLEQACKSGHFKLDGAMLRAV